MMSRTIRPAVLAALVVLLAACTNAVQPSSSPSSNGGTGSSAAPTPGRENTGGDRGGGAIGYVGCSMTRAAVAGYHEMGGTRFWPAIEDYGQGSLDVWARDLGAGGRYWAAFERFLGSMPTKLIWWQLCTHPEPDDQTNYDLALAILGGIEKRVPGATVYVSGQSGYLAPYVCAGTGPDGPDRMQALADRLVQEGRALAGPDLGDLRGPTSAGPGNNEVAEDGCHPNAEGRRLLGQRLAAFAPFSRKAAGAAPAAGTDRPAAQNSGPGSEKNQARAVDGELLLASSFERPVCGTWYGNRDKVPQCEFGIEGGVEAGPFEPRTGAQAVRLDRTSPEHMGVIADLPLPGGHAFMGVAHRVPALPDGAIADSPGHIQLQQMSPTDGTLLGTPVEVRLYPDRRLGLALFGEQAVVMADWEVPVDQWFYLVVEVANGAPGAQHMWVYDQGDRLVAEAEAMLMTRDPSTGRRRTAQKVGGNTATTKPLFTYVDDWFISTTFRGPMRIGGNGKPLG